MLELRDLTFEYEPHHPVLQNSSLVVKPGDVIWIKGSNASGKTTLLKIIAQLLPAQGQILFNKEKITSLNKKLLLSRLTYIPADPYLFDYLNGYENSQFIRDLFGVSKSQFETSFNTIAKELNITSLLNNPVQDYSLGSRHKLFWSCMLSRSTDLFLLDEPFSALDVDSLHIITTFLQNFVSQGASIVFASHLEDISTSFSNRIFTLKAGQLREIIKEE